MADGKCWYALAVKPQHEVRVFEGLSGLGEIEGFLPTYKDKRIWSDRVKILDAPLFPGYVFARFEYPARRVPVLRVAGVRSIVGLGHGPLRGVEGIILEQKDEWRMVVSVELLQRSISVLLDRSVLSRVGGLPG